LTSDFRLGQSKITELCLSVNKQIAYLDLPPLSSRCPLLAYLASFKYASHLSSKLFLDLKRLLAYPASPFGLRRGADFIQVAFSTVVRCLKNLRRSFESPCLELHSILRHYAACGT
jgi:hypothetical protein